MGEEEKVEVKDAPEVADAPEIIDRDAYMKAKRPELFEKKSARSGG